MPLEDLLKWVAAADVVLAADGAANALLRAGAKVDAIIGDLDSLDKDLVPEGVPVYYDSDQDVTNDCDKLLAYAESQGYESITVVGIEGDRLDQVLASLSSFLGSSLHIRLALRQGAAWIIKSGFTEIRCGVGYTISLIPLMPCENLSIDGVQWPLKKEQLSMLERVSISNISTTETVRISMTKGAVLFIVSYPSQEFSLK